jgi:hypothetical protein
METTFHLDSCMNKQNACYWVLQNPEIATDIPLHPQRLNDATVVS